MVERSSWSQGEGNAMVAEVGKLPRSSRPAGFVRDANTGCGITCPPKQLLGPGLGSKASLPTAVVWRGGG